MNKQRFILENVLLEDGFNFDKNIVVSTKVKSKDILISNGKIEGIYEKNSIPEPDENEMSMPCIALQARHPGIKRPREFSTHGCGPPDLHVRVVLPCCSL